MKSIYPVADNELVFVPYNGEISASTASNKKKVAGGGTLAMQYDVATLTWMANTLGYDRVVGIVPDSYFQYQGVTADGWTDPEAIYKGTCKGVLVKEGAWKAVPHEIAHTYKLNLVNVGKNKGENEE
jgi:hypothetical protein